jgi:actin related protein 2/3 complex, subunit 5
MGKYSYKGMAVQSSTSGSQSPSSRKTLSPQATGSGFSQVQSRNFGEGGGGQQMSVLLSWHEKLVELTGHGTIVRVLTDRRTV